MKDTGRAGPEKALDALVREAKRELVPNVGDEAFASMEERILARLAAEPGPLLEDHRRGAGGRRALSIGALVLAAAAAVAVVARTESGVLGEGAPVAQAEVSAGSLRATEGAGDVRVDGQAVAPGHELRVGDVLEVDGARAVLERPRKVAWLLESQVGDGTGAPRPGGEVKGLTARARVKAAGPTLVLGLEDGAIEAQVTPVPSGEAFAVDVAAGSSLVRVAVHGTHLRVARTGSRVVVDLTEGVVSIGAPPRMGATYGTLVTAPSHVEFDATDLAHTLTVEHAPAAVRAPLALPLHEAVTSRLAEPQAPVAREAPTQAGLSTPAVPAASVALPGELSRARDRLEPKTSPEPAAPTLAARPPREAIAAAVSACAAARHRPDNIRVTVTSSLKLKVGPNGAVESARFDPPLLPAIQSCAAAEIYKASLAGSAGSEVSIPIEFSY